LSFLRSKKPDPAPPVPEPAAEAPPAAALPGTSPRKRRLESGGRNATFLAQTAAAVAADRAPNTLTGLNG
jgi:hypothetical protein